MRVILKECQKILDVRIVLILLLFTILFYKIFIELVYINPYGKNGTRGAWDNYPFGAELVREFGTKVSIADWKRLEDKREKLKSEFTEVIQKNETLAAADIHTYDEMVERADELLAKYIGIETGEDGVSDFTEQEKKVREEIDSLVFREEKVLKDDIEYLDDLISRKDQAFGMSEKNYVSLLPWYLFNLLSTDVPRMCMLILIWYFVLIVFYQVREKLRGTVPLYASTHTGRKIFGKQFAACILTCAVVGAVHLLVYFCIMLALGMGPFLACESWSSNGFIAVGDGSLTFGTYLLIYAVLFLIASIAAIVIVYLIGRVSSNYIVGIGLSIPVLISICLGMIYTFKGLFTLDRDWEGISELILARLKTPNMPYWQIPVIASWVFVMTLLIVWRLVRDRRLDL